MPIYLATNDTSPLPESREGCSSDSVRLADIILIIATAANILLTLFQIYVDYRYKVSRGKPYHAGISLRSSDSPRTSSPASSKKKREGGAPSPSRVSKPDPVIPV